MTRQLWFSVVVLILCTGMAHTMAYHDEVALEQERKLALKKRQAQPNPGRIWSKKCEAKGMDVLAKQADGGRWVINCIPRRALSA